MASSSAAAASSGPSGTPTFQLTRDQFEAHEVWQLYQGYLSPGDAQDPNFENFYQLCLRFGYIPSLDMINWIISQAFIIDPSRRLQYPVYAFLQEFKFDLHVDNNTHQPRMIVAHVHTDIGPCPIWAGWWPATGNASKPKMKLYLKPQADEDGTGEIQISEEYRVALKWEEPFEVLFKLSKYEPTHAQASIQNSILLSVVKVLVRFPGLIKPRPGLEKSGAWLDMRLAFSSRPFDIREVPSRFSPCWDAFRLLHTGKDGLTTNHAFHPPGTQGHARFLEQKAEQKVVQAEKRAEQARKKAEGEDDV